MGELILAASLIMFIYVLYKTIIEEKLKKFFNQIIPSRDLTLNDAHFRNQHFRFLRRRDVDYDINQIQPKRIDFDDTFSNFGFTYNRDITQYSRNNTSVITPYQYRRQASITRSRSQTKRSKALGNSIFKNTTHKLTEMQIAASGLDNNISNQRNPRQREQARITAAHARQEEARVNRNLTFNFASPEKKNTTSIGNPSNLHPRRVYGLESNNRMGETQFNNVIKKSKYQVDVSDFKNARNRNQSLDSVLRNTYSNLGRDRTPRAMDYFTSFFKKYV